MKMLAAAPLCASLLIASSSLALASGSGSEPTAEQAAEQAVPEISGQTEGQASKDETESDKDVMKNFTRHRPGACPEGPPCSVED